MYEDPGRDGWWGTRRVPTTPMPVWVNLSLVLPPSQVGIGGVPVRVRASGLDISTHASGELLSWHQTMTGDWWASVRMTVTNRTRKAELNLVQLVPASAVAPKD